MRVSCFIRVKRRSAVVGGKFIFSVRCFTMSEYLKEGWSANNSWVRIWRLSSSADWRAEGLDSVETCIFRSSSHLKQIPRFLGIPARRFLVENMRDDSSSLSFSIWRLVSALRSSWLPRWPRDFSVPGLRWITPEMWQVYWMARPWSRATKSLDSAESFTSETRSQ